MAPASALNAPVMRLKNVLLPAPFGPMTAVSEPSAKSSVTSSVAFTPPKDFERPRISSMSAALPRRIAPLCDPFEDKIHQTFAQANGEEQDHDPQHDAVIFGDPRHGVVEDQQYHRADHRPE